MILGRWNGLTGFSPVLDELGDALVRQRVGEKLPNNVWRDRGHIGPHFRGLNNVHRRAHRGDQHFRFECGIGVVDLANIRDQLHAVLPDIVQTSHERRDERRPRLGRQNRLRRREA